MDSPERDFEPENIQYHFALCHEGRLDSFSSDELLHDAIGGFQALYLVLQYVNIARRRSRSARAVVFQQCAEKKEQFTQELSDTREHGGPFSMKASVLYNEEKIMKRIVIIAISALLIPAITAGKDATKPSVDTIQVLKIAGQDQRAVIKTPDGKTRIIKPGDSLGANGKVTEIAADRVVVEEKKGNATEKVIIRLINGKQKVERFKKTGEQAPVMLMPAKKDVKANKDGKTNRQENSFN